MTRKWQLPSECEKSKELEGKGQGAYERGEYSQLRQKKIVELVIGDYLCATNLCINRVGVVKEWAGSLASRT